MIDQLTEITVAQGAAPTKDAEAPTQLFVPSEAQEFRTKWEKIQAGFVDEPRKAVKDADELVDAAIKKLSEIFAEERAKLEREWDRGDDVSTEDLRLAFRRYRSFFDRLLSV
jgi:5'-deoxynucleotidase YfbR-like HD superfamily hydrolase